MTIETPSSDDLAFAGLRRQADLLAAREVSATELVERALARIDATQGTLNAFRIVRRDAARAEAAAADARLAAGERLPLLGVPVAVKDDMDVAGESTPFGCAGDFPTATADGAVTAKLRAAGAVVIGKTTTPEFGQWPFTESTSCGPTRNPWHLDHTPGGSSGGSAAAVAGGLVAAAVGSDGAGSVRIPASWTHLVGVKPQRGRVSTLPAPELFDGISCYGPLARTVDDAALLLDVLTGNLPGDRHRPPAPPEPFVDAARREPRRLRIALSYRVPFSAAPVKLDAAVRARIERMAQVLEGLGHAVERADPEYGLIGLAFLPRSLGGVREFVERVPDQSLLDPRTRANGRAGRVIGAPPLRALSRRAEPLLHRHVGQIFRRFDVVLTPTTALPPTRIGQYDGLSGWATDQTMVRACPYTYAWNVLGWPGVSVPAGFVRDGLPIGAQLLGPANGEGPLLALAAQLESAERWHEKVPGGA